MGSMEPNAIKGVVSLRGHQSVDATVEKVKSILQAKNVKLFAVVDHSGEARNAGLKMPDTKLLIFGNPAGGTPAMLAAPTLALDLPLKVLIYDDGGTTRVCYAPPAELARRYGLSDEQAAHFAGINALTDALLAT